MRNIIFAIWVWFGHKLGVLPAPTKGKKIKLYMSGNKEGGVLTTHFARDAVSFQRAIRDFTK
tara:strand:- start:109 stop:294 length:186 start_codon:yes stop_codon:yes gene_type:complete